MADQTSSTKIIHLKRRGALVLQAVIFLVFGVSCAAQGYMRLNYQADKFWNSWWFFAILTVGFLYLAIEAIYKIFFNRLVLSPEELIMYDFLKTTRVRWDMVKKVGELDLKDRKKIDFGVIIKDTAVEKPNLLAVPFISLVPYFSSWKESPIHQWIKEHHPRLLSSK